jgi:hypothetical protein
MKPLQLLNNVQKARLLHSLLINEMPEFLKYLNEFTETVLNDKERIAAEWKDQLFEVGIWFELAAEVQPKDLYKSSAVFADQLFGGFMAIFSAHALVQYVTLRRNTDPKFKPAVELLFG